MNNAGLTYSAIITAPIGQLGIVTADEALQKIVFLPSQKKPVLPKDDFSREVVAQLNAYFNDPKFSFDLPLALSTTPYQWRVLKALQKIPVGKTKSYGGLALQLKSGARAIGNACRRNPIPVVIPCHRIVAKNHLGGFSGATQGRKLSIKQWLLEHEASV